MPPKHTHIHSMLTLPSISVYSTRRFVHTVTHSLCWDQRYAVFSCALPFFMTLSCQCYLLQTCTQTHTEHTHKLTLPQTHTRTCILTNLMEAITELSPSCWLAIKCFPPLSQYRVSVSVSFHCHGASMIATFTALCPFLVWLTHKNITISFF